jgi:hypothetical protein
MLLAAANDASLGKWVVSTVGTVAGFNFLPYRQLLAPPFKLADQGVLSA